MAKVEVLEPYELLIRYTNGVPTGAHVQNRRKVLVDGELLLDEVQPAEPLTLDSDFPTSQIMDETARQALAENLQLKARIEGLEAQMAAQAQAIADATARLAEISGAPDSGTEAV